MRSVRFVRSALPYNAGELAGFPEAVARRLVRQGVAEFPESAPPERAGMPSPEAEAPVPADVDERAPAGAAAAAAEPRPPPQQRGRRQPRAAGKGTG